MSEGDESEEEVKVRRKGRVVVDSELGNPDDIGFGYLEQARAAIIEEDDDDEEERVNTRNRRSQRNQRRTRRRQVVNSGETSQMEEAHDDRSDYNTGRRARDLRVNQRNRADVDMDGLPSQGRTRNRLHRPVVEDDDMSQNESIGRRPGLRRLHYEEKEDIS